MSYNSPHLENIEKKIAESDQIINNLLYYSRIKMPNYEKININSIIEECVGFLQKQVRSKKKILIKKELSLTKGILIEADPLQIGEVLCNILNNSSDAVLESNGKIEIISSNEGGPIKICIKDNGAGIDKQNLDKVFEPFFTTKAKGTGLGLAVSYQIVNLHGGIIEIESDVGKGTSTSIILPRRQSCI